MSAVAVARGAVRGARAAAFRGISVVHRDRTPLALDEVRNVLVIRTDEIGDVVLSTPFLRGLRAGLPRARIALVTSPAGAALLEGSPWLDRILPFTPPFDGIVPDPRRLQRVRDFTRETFGPASPDLAIMPRFDYDPRHSALLALWSGSPLRVGYGSATTALRRERNAGVDALLTTVVPDRGVRHEVERGLDVLGALGLPHAGEQLELPSRAEDDERATELLDGLDAPVAVAPGAGSQRREWPVERYRDVVRELGRDAIVVGGRGDRALGRAIAEAGALDLTGRLSLRETTAVLRRCSLYLGADSGPAHLAAAAGIPAVVVSCHPQGASPQYENAPERFRPWGVEARVVRPAAPAGPGCAQGCVYNEAHCILEVKSSDVLTAVTETP